MSHSTPRQKSSLPKSASGNSVVTPQAGGHGIFKPSELSRITKSLSVKAIAAKDAVEVTMFSRVTIPNMAPGSTKQFPLFHEPSSVPFRLVHTMHQALPSSGTLHAPEADPQAVLAAKELGIKVVKYRRGTPGGEGDGLSMKITVRNFAVCLVVKNSGGAHGHGRVGVRSPEPIGGGRASPTPSMASTVMNGDEKEGTDYLLAIEMEVGYVYHGPSDLPACVSIPTPFCLRNTLKFVLPSSSSSLLDVVSPSRRSKTHAAANNDFEVKVLPALREKASNVHKTVNRRRSMAFEGIASSSEDEGDAPTDDGDTIEGNFSSTEKLDIRWVQGTSSNRDGMEWKTADTDFEMRVGRYTESLLDPDQTEGQDVTVSSTGRVPVNFTLISKLSGLTFPSCDDTGLVELEIDSFVNSVSEGGGAGEMLKLEDVKVEGSSIASWEIVNSQSNTKVTTSRGLQRRPSSIYSDLASSELTPGKRPSAAPLQSRPSSIASAASAGSGSDISLMNTRAPFGRESEIEMSFENSINHAALDDRRSPSPFPEREQTKSTFILKMYIDVLQVLKEFAETTAQAKTSPMIDSSSLTPTLQFTMEGTMLLAFKAGEATPMTSDSESDSWIDVEGADRRNLLPLPLFRYINVQSQTTIITVIPPSPSSRGRHSKSEGSRIKIPNGLPVLPLDPSLRLPSNAIRTRLALQPAHRGFVAPLNARLHISIPSSSSASAFKAQRPLSPPASWEPPDEHLVSPLSRGPKGFSSIRDSKDNLLSSIASTSASASQSPNMNSSLDSRRSLPQPPSVDITEISLSSVKILLAPAVEKEKDSISYGHITTFLPYFSPGENEERRTFVIQFEVATGRRIVINPGSWTNLSSSDGRRVG
ncbi:hypothetical protein BT69DRAFT_524879 [Atractiella rhizophila]|nr:hypothetical protein BT69DRAFT_524879 [Atractiella rhizophila]